ncbi:MAG: diguanylate cyclase [Ruminococcaceae bacterium]|nr:diguanylate cyclase [Oscillospiraceae bacterium]
MSKKINENAVNEALQLPLSDRFEADLEALLYADDAQSGNPIIVALLDLDQFDRVNVNFGHDVGDRTLIAIGQHIAANVPECGRIYRVGGDEFGIIFHGEFEREDVFLLLERIRASVDVTVPDGSAQTISAGLAEAFTDAARVPELIRMAQSAMFRAKLNGGNRVAIAREEKMVPKTSHYTADQLKRLTKLSRSEGIGEAILLREALDMLLKKYDK